jgi:triacylglycerol lipase
MTWLQLVLLLLAVIVVLAIAIVAAPRRRRGAPAAPGAPEAPAAPGEPRPPSPYPIVLVHGFLGFGEIRLFGRSFRYFRGVAEAMAETGASVHIVTLPPLASVPDRARILAEAVRALPAPRVHLVAHSMGGIDARYAIARLGLTDRVASLVTIGTPHRGTPLARLAHLAPITGLRRVVARAGIRSDAADGLTPESMTRFNEEVLDQPDVYYACVVGSARWRSTNPALWTSRVLMGRSAGLSDAIVPAASQHWGEVIAEIDADHWAQIGWSPTFDARTLYREIALCLRAREATGPRPESLASAARPAATSPAAESPAQHAR